jgi:hypothetical protein
VPPRSLSFFEQLAATPPALPPDADQRFSRPTENARPWTMPAGEPADQATVDGITATLREALACLNANDPLRFLALFSDEMLRIFFALDPIPPEALPSLAASPVASPPEQRLGYLAIHDVLVCRTVGLPPSVTATIRLSRRTGWVPTSPSSSSPATAG